MFAHYKTGHAHILENNNKSKDETLFHIQHIYAIRTSTAKIQNKWDCSVVELECGKNGERKNSRFVFADSTFAYARIENSEIRYIFISLILFSVLCMPRARCRLHKS